MTENRGYSNDTPILLPSLQTTLQCFEPTSPSIVKRNTRGSPKVVATWRPAPVAVKSSTAQESSCPAGPNLMTPRRDVEIRLSFLRSLIVRGSTTYDALCAASLSRISGTKVPGSMYVRVRLHV